MSASIESISVKDRLELAVFKYATKKDGSNELLYRVVGGKLVQEFDGVFVKIPGLSWARIEELCEKYRIETAPAPQTFAVSNDLSEVRDYFTTPLQKQAIVQIVGFSNLPERLQKAWSDLGKASMVKLSKSDVSKISEYFDVNVDKHPTISKATVSSLYAKHNWFLGKN